MDNIHSIWIIHIPVDREPNSNCFVPKQRYPRGGLSYSDIHDQEVLDSLSDRPWKEKEGWNANIRLLSRPIVPILGTSSAKVTEWGSRQSLKRTMYFICWVTGAFYQRFRLYQSTLVWFLLNHILRGAGRTISKRTPPPHSLDREDRQDFAIRCRTYSISILCLEEDSNLHAF